MYISIVSSIFAPIKEFFGGMFSSILIPIAKFFGLVYQYIQSSPFFTTNLFNFIIVVGFFVWLLFFQLDITGIFAKKQKEIIGSINSSENRKNDAIKFFEETKNSLKNVDNDIKKIDTDAKSLAQKIEEQNSVKIQKEIANIENRTDILKTNHENKAKEEVSQQIANAAIAVSKEYIENSLDENTQKELIYNFIEDLENMRVE